MTKIARKCYTKTVTGHLQFQVGYYRALVDDDPVTTGDLVYATEHKIGKSKGDDDEPHPGFVHFLYFEDSYHIDYDTFQANYAYEPDGEKIRLQHMQALSAEIQDLEVQEVTLNSQAVAFIPHVTGAGEFSTASETTQLATTSTTVAAKKTIATFRNDVAKLKNNVLSKSHKLKLLVKEQQAIMEAKLHELTAGIQEKVTALQTIVEKAEEAIWTINLYLGTQEVIVPLQNGKPAPATTPITIRQLVLFMDEECAVAADVGGIDANDIIQFDAWLTESPKHIQQIIPEEKCVIALKPRRHHIHYGDPWVDQNMAKANKHTYFLIRNGENLYRIFVDFDAGHTLIPERNEFLDVFYESDFDWKTHKRVKKPIVPGSEEYMRAMERSDARSQHYFRVALIMQGLLDRTKILHPLPVPHLNVLNPTEHGEYLNFIHDAEMDRMLPSGWPTYDEWLKTANAGISVGQRIMGFFRFKHGGEHYDQDSIKYRLLPTTASHPSSEELHTIACRGDKPESFYFYYHRSDTIWRRYDESGESKVRARCTIHADDKFILNFDAPNVTVEAMRYYVDSRRDRHAYMDMVPLLQRAIAIKESEALDEAPFHKLLTGQIMQSYSVSHETAAAAIPDLVHWWKFKNQTHRALLSDDVTALNMILKEFGIRQKRSDERIAAQGDDLVLRLLETVLRAEPQAVLVAHKKGNEYVALIAHNASNVYVKEQVWTINRSSNCAAGDRIRLKYSKEWRTVDTRWERWEVLHKHDRWDAWIMGATAKGYLTDPELDQIADTAVDLLCDRRDRIWSKRDREEFDADDWKAEVIPLALVLHHRHGIDHCMAYNCDCQAILPTTSLLDDGPYEPSIMATEIEWKRDVKGAITFTLKRGMYHNHVSVAMHDLPWGEAYTEPYSEARNRVRVLREWPDNILLVSQQQALYRLYRERVRDLGNIAREAVDSIDDQILDREWGKVYAEYLREFGDPELWEDHKKTVRMRPRMYKDLRPLLQALIGRGMDCNGMSLTEVFEKGTPLLAERKSRKRFGYFNTEPPGQVELHPDDAELVVAHSPMPSEQLCLENALTKAISEDD